MVEVDHLYNLLPRRVKCANIVVLKTISIGALLGGFTCIVAIAVIGNPIGNRNKSIATLSLSGLSLIGGFVALASSIACDEADRYHDYLEQQEQRSILRRFGASEHLDRATIAAYLSHEQAQILAPHPSHQAPNNPPKPSKSDSPPLIGQPIIPQTAPLPSPSMPAQVLESQLKPPTDSAQALAKMPGIHPTTNVTPREKLADVLSGQLEKIPMTAHDSTRQAAEIPLSEDEIIAKAIKCNSFSTVEELITLLTSPRYYWLRIVCLSRLLMMIGDQGSGKTSFSKFVCAVRQLLWQHTIAIHDPHAEKNGWPENWTVKGHHKNYGDIDQGIDDYFDAVDTTDGSGLRLTFLFDEVTQYKDSLPDSEKSQKFVKSWCSDVRKSDVCLIALTHSDTNEGLAGTKGMKASIESSFLRLFLGNQIDPETGDFVPNFKGILIGLNRDEFNKPQQTAVRLEQWMQLSFIKELLFPKISQTAHESDVGIDNNSSRTAHESDAGVGDNSSATVSTASTLSAEDPDIVLSREEMNIQGWRAAIFPSQLDLLPKNTEGLFAICIDGYNPVYIGLLNELMVAHFGRTQKPFYSSLQSLVQEGHQPYIAFLIPQNRDIESIKGALSQLLHHYHPIWNYPAEKANTGIDNQQLKLTEQQQAVINFAIKNKGEISTRQAMRELGGKLKCKSAEEALSLFQSLEKMGFGKIYEEPTKSGSSIRFYLASSSPP